jgi:2-desacetyl-2-hydroxyethyl bacteriochlorophyllide A dehydrogenase
MRAAVFQAAGQPLSLKEVPIPSPGPGEVLVKVESCGICASDLHLTAIDAGDMTFPRNSIIGHEYAGDVVAVGESVTAVGVGSRLVGFPFIGCGMCMECAAGRIIECKRSRPIGGAYAQYTIAPARGSVVIPPNIDYELGALVEPMAVGLHATRLASLSPASKVLVLGAGTIGLATAHWARRVGVNRLVVLARSEWRSRLAITMGATSFVVVGAQEIPAVTEALDGSPDVIFECIGQSDSLQMAVEHAAPRATVISMGFAIRPSVLAAARAAYKGLTIRFMLGYVSEEFQDTAKAIADGSINPRPLITRRIGLAKLPAEFESLRANSRQCKVMVHPWLEPAG